MDMELEQEVRKVLARSYPLGYSEEIFNNVMNWFETVEIEVAIMNMAFEGMVNITWVDNDIMVKLNQEDRIWVN